MIEYSKHSGYSSSPEKIDLLYRTRPEFFDEVSLLVID